LGWIVKTLVLCFIVGFLISFFEINPARILTDGWETVQDVYELLAAIVGWALPYILIGAVVVVPLSLLSLFLRWTRARGDRP
jgi:hypothetical protein